MLLLFLLSCEFAPKTLGVSVLDATNATIAEVVAGIVVGAIVFAAIVVAASVVAEWRICAENTW